MFNIFQEIISIYEHQHFYVAASMLFCFMLRSPRNLYGMLKLYQNLGQGRPLPERLSDFPIHSTSIEDYLVSIEKVNLFVSQALKNVSCQLKLDTNDINNLYLRGEAIDKYKADYNLNTLPIFRYVNEYYYFQIIGNRFLEKRIEYISLRGNDGIFTETRETRFIKKNNLNMTNSNVIKRNEKKMGSDSDWNSDKFHAVNSKNSLLYNLFTSFLRLSPYDENESQINLIVSIIEKITTIEIVDGYLTIEVKQ